MTADPRRDPPAADQYARRTVTVDIGLYRLADGEIKRRRVRGLWVQFGLLAFVLVALLLSGGGPW